MMHSFLSVAGERVADDMARALVRQVRNIAIDVEDCIESVMHLDKRSNWWRRMLPFFMPARATLAALDEVVTNLELLKARIEALGQRKTRYNHTGDSSSKPVKQEPQQLGMARAAPFHVLAKVREAAKKQSDDPWDLIKLITRKPNVPRHQVVSVWGTGVKFALRIDNISNDEPRHVLAKGIKFALEEATCAHLDALPLQKLKL
ncbi:hypothetical protein BAE44_0004025 [Dichanthelium oligosanthes]|uniref:Disease resistance N-terminal domain-containing protein n=1 Tax=Dichanthelium oligosanthes TaxID=888268 RepID=A0A1E5WC01_9POAL|nr:hypothetical protein BAE44_0004025 [Dichanthelium oligosanthes]